jgi:hypothetical protein
MHDMLSIGANGGFTLFDNAKIVRLALHDNFQLLDVPSYFGHFTLVELGSGFEALYGFYISRRYLKGREAAERRICLVKKRKKTFST